MQQDWRDLNYLLHGTATQKAAYHTLKSLRLFLLLHRFDPVLAGTIPLDINLPGSDLDIVCCAVDVEDFAQNLSETFGYRRDFRLRGTSVYGWKNYSSASQGGMIPKVIATFAHQDFLIEIFGQPLPTMSQAAIRHLDVEAQLLRHGGEKSRQKIHQLKSQGLKTEPAFAAVFSLVGDPYQTLLDLSEQSEEVLISIASAAQTTLAMS